MTEGKKDVKKVEIYTTPTCVYCRAAKDFFKEYDVNFEEYNVAFDIEKRKEMLEKTGQMGVPVIVIDEKVIIGYDPMSMSRALGIKT